MLTYQIIFSKNTGSYASDVFSDRGLIRALILS